MKEKSELREWKESFPGFYSPTEFARLVLRLRLVTPSHTETPPPVGTPGKAPTCIRRPVTNEPDMRGPVHCT